RPRTEEEQEDDEPGAHPAAARPRRARPLDAQSREVGALRGFRGVGGGHPASVRVAERAVPATTRCRTGPRDAARDDSLRVLAPARTAALLVVRRATARPALLELPAERSAPRRLLPLRHGSLRAPARGA